MKVITDEQLQQDIIKSMHEGLGDTLESTSIGGYAGRTKLEAKLQLDISGPK